MTPLDRYALQLADQGHSWTPIERRLYELATMKKKKKQRY